MIRYCVFSMLTPVLCVSAVVSADVVGRMTPADALTPSRVAALPAAERGPWIAYLER